MERQELEARLADREVLNQLGIIHRDLQRPIPDIVRDKAEYGHERDQYTYSIGNWIGVYRIQHEKHGVDNQSETFTDLKTRDSGYYDSIIKCILGAVNEKFILV